MRAIVLQNIGTYEHLYETDIKSYKDYYEHLKCELFDVVRVRWNGEDISIFVDDEGLFKPNNYGRKVEGYPNPLFGNMVICGGVDAEGDTLSLPDTFNIINVLKFIGEIEYVTTRG